MDNNENETPNVEVNVGTTAGSTENTAVAPAAPATDAPEAAPDVPNIPEPSETKDQ